MISPFEDHVYFMQELEKALADMPRLVQKKKLDYKKKQKFLKETWGDAIAALEKELAKKAIK
jgi:hypothetical protein